MDMQIVKRTQLESGDFQFFFALPVGYGRIKGMDALIQRVLFSWMTTRGSVKSDPNFGGGLIAAMKLLRQSNDFARFASDVAASIERTEGHLLVSQSALSIGVAEKLLSFDLLNIENKGGGEAAIQVQVTNEAGETLVFGV
jgi:hypothetical protein